MIKARGINQAEVFASAIKIAAQGQMPTTANIRQELGRGSETTLHKYLQEWKTLLLKNAARVWQNTKLSLLDENKILRGNLDELTASLANYAKQLQELEWANSTLSDENAVLKNERQQQALTIATLQAKVEILEQTIEQSTQGNLQIISTLMADKNHMLESLQNEMRQTQVDAIEKMREASFKEHDLLIQERVKILNMQTELARLQAMMPKVKEMPWADGQAEPSATITAKNSRAQLLSELYAQKAKIAPDPEDELDVSHTQ